MPESACLLLGSNLQPERHLMLAAARLAELGTVRAASAIYQSPPIARPGQPDFLNAAVRLEGDWDVGSLRRALRDVESALGRVRAADKHAPRTIDLDIILFGALVTREPVEIPAPDLLTQAHVAVPIAELDPAARHPGTGERLGSIAARLAVGARLRRRDDLSWQAMPA